ncbi:MAG TPA: TetR/AcrR family transcriptional regulator [Actinomycetota bacterium]|nr:TetR/AcrR family transcriptional regulator [Actinomycetota bacterium]
MARPGRRAEMIGVAARLFSARGYHGTSMQHLGDALGLLRGSLYAHIGSKEELLAEIVEAGADRFLARGRRAVELDAPAPHRLRAFLVGHVETVAEHIDAATVFLNEWRYLSPEARARIGAKRDDYEAMLRRIVDEGIAAGELRADIDRSLATKLVLSAGNWLYAWYRPDGGSSAREVGDGFADMLVRGLEEAS